MEDEGWLRLFFGDRSRLLLLLYLEHRVRFCRLCSFAGVAVEIHPAGRSVMPLTRPSACPLPARRRQRLRWPRLRAARGHAQLQRLLKQPTPGPALWLTNWLLRPWLRMLLSALSTLPPQIRLHASRAPPTRASRPHELGAGNVYGGDFSLIGH